MSNDVLKNQEEAVEVMGLDIEGATDCGPESHKVQKKAKAELQQEEAVNLMGGEIEQATDCGCSAS